MSSLVIVMPDAGFTHEHREWKENRAMWHPFFAYVAPLQHWIPAFAGMTKNTKGDL